MKTNIFRSIFAVVLVSLLLITSPRAQRPAAQTSSEDRVELYQALLDLQNPWTVMCVAAHPDDEDGTSLIVMRRKFGANTVSLFSTFGEGGQNAIGPELYEELGAIRARETMAASEIQGSKPYFLGLKDFGFSKSAAEAFKFWGHDEALRRMVLEIRRQRPDVIITNHSVTSNDHGHHQATARMVVEAFDAAADPSRFPEQLKDGVSTWQVQRLFVRVRGNQPPPAGTQIVTLDPNERDPARGVVYAEEALRALQQHATQGPWPKSFAEFANRFRAATGQNSTPGQLPLIRYRVEKEAKGVAPLSADPHNFVDGLVLTAEAAKQIPNINIDGKPLTDFVDQRDRVLDALVAANKQKIFGGTPDGPDDVLADLRRSRMRVKLYKALAAAAGISASLESANNVLVPGHATPFELALINKGAEPIRVDLVASGAGSDNKGNVIMAQHHPRSNLAPGQSVKIPTTYKLSEKAPLTVPHAEHLYDKDYAGAPVAVAAYIDFRDTRFPVIAHKLADVVPPVELSFVAPALLVLTPTTQINHPTFIVNVVNHENASHTGRLVAMRPGMKAVDLGDRVTIQPGGSSQLKLPTANVFGAAPEAGPFNISIAWQDDNGRHDPAAARSVPVVNVDAKIASSNLRVGFIRGFDYSLPNALAALGVQSKELTLEDVKSGNLQQYTSVVVDNRVYESQPDLIPINQKLLDYANAGGNLIVFYHKTDEWNPDQRRNRPQLAPYKLILGNERITVEEAPITFLEPDHPLRTTPNKRNQDDFKGWIQERGLYYPKEWDPQFHALLESNDPGEAPLKGGLLLADAGRGHYIYTSMVWYRQLRAGVPGAYRMLANMISYGRN